MSPWETQWVTDYHFSFAGNLAVLTSLWGGGEKIVRVSPGGVDWESVGGGTKVAALLNNRSV